jgi:hypothetical protein
MPTFSLPFISTDVSRRPEAQGELYTYLPLTPGNSTRLQAVPPLSKSNTDFGFSVGRGSFHFDIAVGTWVSMAFRVKLNGAGKENGNTLPAVQLFSD